METINQNDNNNEKGKEPQITSITCGNTPSTPAEFRGNLAEDSAKMKILLGL